MKKAIFLFMTLLTLGLPLGVVAESTIDRAHSAYDREHYQEALQLYLQEAQNTGTSSNLFYNIGNAYYRMSDYTHAILYYERALRLNPANSDARANLDFVRSQAKISEDTGASFFANVVMNVVNQVPSNTWAVVAALAFSLFLLAVALYIFVDSVWLRKLGFFGGGALLVVTLVAVACAWQVRALAVEHREAIVVAHSSTLSVAPHAPNAKEEAFVLREGQKVTIQDSVSNTAGVQVQVWYRIETADSRQAWIRSTDVEKI